jgi:hypothetical protein
MTGVCSATFLSQLPGTPRCEASAASVRIVSSTHLYCSHSFHHATCQPLSCIVSPIEHPIIDRFPFASTTTFTFTANFLSSYGGETQALPLWFGSAKRDSADSKAHSRRQAHAVLHRSRTASRANIVGLPPTAPRLPPAQARRLEDRSPGPNGSQAHHVVPKALLNVALRHYSAPR